MNKDRKYISVKDKIEVLKRRISYESSKVDHRGVLTPDFRGISQMKREIKVLSKCIGAK